MSEYVQTTCTRCAKVDPGSWVPDTAAEIIKHGLCFSCNFWRKVVIEVARGESFIARAEGYTPGPESSRGDFGFRGFGGRQFRFKVGDGPERTSTNMWFRGAVPAVWRDDLPDNAVILATT